MPSRRSCITIACAFLALTAADVRGQPRTPQPPSPLERLAIHVTPRENRGVVFTNKRAAFFYTQTHRNDHPEHAWFRGFTIAGRRIFNDYVVTVGGRALDPAAADAIVRPDALIRRYPGGVIETLELFDHVDVVGVSIAGTNADVTLRLTGEHLAASGTEGALALYQATDGAAEPASADVVVVGRTGDRFYIAVGPTRDSARALWRRASENGARWEAERRARLAGLVSGDHELDTDDPRLTKSLRWITLITDALVTRQRGEGIYAGLPWFPEYWGRDSFIALAGATLVTGQFAEARAILVSFARFQDRDTTSAFFGRLPNIVKPGSIDYHTTDGTPRWVIALRDYVRYSGDRTVVRELYPNVAASIDGSLAHFTDSAGYLVHADNETWMDARREPDHASYSPRATRANDVQALWYAQLRAGAAFATMMGRPTDAERWEKAATRLHAHFAQDFVDAGSGRIADHLDARGAPDFTMRPNLLFALDLVDGPTADRATKRAWEALVYPWGTATLAQDDSFFHPYHVAWEHYHKDEAYHNGTIWPWLDGIAMQRMIERGQGALAWRLFRSSSDLALSRGVVGGLPETMDAYPHPGEMLPRLTGTFLQAWSNSEWLRVWYQDFLGVRPDLLAGRITLAPRLPDAVGTTDFTVRVGNGTLGARYQRDGSSRRYAYRLVGQAASLVVDIVPYDIVGFPVADGDSLVADVRGDGVHVRVVAATGVVRRHALLRRSSARLETQAATDRLLGGTSFATPRTVDSHPVMRQVYQRR